jgi:HEAT repeat protein
MAGKNSLMLIIGAALQLGAAASLSAEKPAQKPTRATPAKPAAKPKLDVAALTAALESGDEQRALAALDEIEKSGEPSAAPPVEALLNRGASSVVVVRALAALGSLAQPSSGAAIVPYCQHRSPEIRRGALDALIKTESPLAGEALRRALRGSDPALRRIAARGLGQLDVREAVPELFTVLTKDVPEAARALGLLCSGAECEKFIGMLGKLRFDVMESAMVPLLLRPQADVSDELKLKLIERLRRLATRPANELLEAALARYPADGSQRVKQALERALKGFSVSAEVD